MSKGSGTRSGLLWEVERLLNEVEELPQVLLMENVPQVVSQANIQDFHSWQQFLESKGYKNYTDTLNAKDYEVAQNRNRTFMVSILGDYYYKFPIKKDLTKVISDYLEKEVDEKYYINSPKAKELISKLVVSGQLEGSIGNVNPSGNGINGEVYGEKGLCPTLTTNKGEGQKICVDLSINNPKVKNIVNCITARQDRGISNQQSVGAAVIERSEKLTEVKQVGNIESKTRRGRVQEKGEISPTITATETGIHKIETPYRIRKLTPKECWRLMGFTDKDFHKAEKVNSNTQLYKQAGNSIVVNVLEEIFKQML